MARPCENRPCADELRRLYVDERLTSRAIAEGCGVDKITVLRWLKAAGIERRASGRGLANRGGERPPAEVLRRHVHDEHLSYQQIAALYGVDQSAVPYWLNLHDIDKPTIWGTRRKGAEVTEPDEDELRRRVAGGESMKKIAQDFTVSESRLWTKCHKLGIELTPSEWYSRRVICEDGHPARSSYELRVDNWLHQHGISHEIEPRYPFDARYRADFLVGDTYIEVWGVSGDERYIKRRQWKVTQCQHHGLSLIQIDARQFVGGGEWWESLEQLKDTCA